MRIGLKPSDQITQLIFPFELDGGDAPDVTELIAPDASSGVTMHVRSRRIVFETEVLFMFRVQLDGRERMEWIMPVVIDPMTEQAVRPVPLDRARFFPEMGGRNGDALEYMLTRLYDIARHSMEHRIKRRAMHVLNRARQSELNERRKIESYYSSVMQEELEPIKRTFRQMAVLTVRADLTRASDRVEGYRQQLEDLKAQMKQLEAGYERHVAALAEERQRRLLELSEAYAINAHVSLRAVALLIVPRVRWDVLISGEGERHLDIQYDCLRRRLISWSCEGCELPFTGNMAICRCSSVLCAECISTCHRCGMSSCPECAEVFCGHCGRAACPNCVSPCLLSEVVPTKDPVPVCARCLENLCPYCVAWVASF